MILTGYLPKNQQSLPGRRDFTQLTGKRTEGLLYGWDDLSSLLGAVLLPALGG